MKHAHWVILPRGQVHGIANFGPPNEPVHGRHRDGSVRVYFDFNDWWVGVYRGPNHWYVCPLPTLVVRFRRWGDDR